MCDKVTGKIYLEEWTPAFKVTIVAEEDKVEYTGPYSNTAISPETLQACFERTRAHGGNKKSMDNPNHIGFCVFQDVRDAADYLKTLQCICGNHNSDYLLHRVAIQGITYEGTIKGKPMWMGEHIKFYEEVKYEQTNTN